MGRGRRGGKGCGEVRSEETAGSGDKRVGWRSGDGEETLHNLWMCYMIHTPTHTMSVLSSRLKL